MFKRNVAVTGFGIGHFIGIADGIAVTTGTPTCKRTLDGVGGACSNAAAYNTNGAVWTIDLAASDMNADVVVLSFTLAGCIPISYTIKTNTKLVSDLNDAATAPAASAIAAEILVTPANKLATGTNGVAVANVTQLDGDPVPLDNLVLSLGYADGIVAHPQGIADALKLAPTAGAPADGSVNDHLDDLAAALAAATSTLTVVSAVDGDVITIYQAVSFQATISGLAIPAAWTKLYFTVKQDPGQADADAIIQMVETATPAGTDGLLRLNGAAGTAANGTLTVSQATGTVVIDLVDDTTAVLALATGLHWSLKALYSTSASILLAKGTLNVRGQATAAMS